MKMLKRILVKLKIRELNSSLIFMKDFFKKYNIIKIF